MIRNYNWQAYFIPVDRKGNAQPRMKRYSCKVKGIGMSEAVSASVLRMVQDCAPLDGAIMRLVKVVNLDLLKG